MPVDGSYAFKLLSRLKVLKTPIRTLRSLHGSLSKRVNDLRIEVEEVQREVDVDPHNPILQEDLAHILTAFEDALQNEEQNFRQKTKVRWIKEGDLNTAFFHRVVKEKKKQSLVDSVMDSHGRMVYGSEVGPTFVEHFQAILGEKDNSVSTPIPLNLF